MKPVLIIAFALLVAGCSTSTKPSDVLTAEQAQAMAVGLANSNALERFHREPFESGPPAQFEQGRWVWTTRAGYGRGDIEARVELAEDGSTNNVQLRLLDSRSQEFLRP